MLERNPVWPFGPSRKKSRASAGIAVREGRFIKSVVDQRVGKGTATMFAGPGVAHPRILAHSMA